MLYKSDKDAINAAHPLEGGQTEAGGLTPSSLPLLSWVRTSGCARGIVQAHICHCLPPDRTWHKVNDSGGLGEGDMGYELKLEPCGTMMQLAHPKVAQPKPGRGFRSEVCFCWTVPEQTCKPPPPGFLKEACLYRVKSVACYSAAWTESSSIKNRSGNTVLLKPDIGFER